MKQTRKAEVDPMKLIMLAILLIIVVIVVVVIFRNVFGKQAKSLDEQASGLYDCDGDGTADFLDPCPCDPDNTKGCYPRVKSREGAECVCFDPSKPDDST